MKIHSLTARAKDWAGIPASPEYCGPFHQFRRRSGGHAGLMQPDKHFMCGRFIQRYTWQDIQDLYDLAGAPRNLQAHCNIAPTDTVEVVRPADSGANQLVPMRWGFVPWWWKKALKDVPAAFNARSETTADKPMFRDSFKHRRCIVPASAYYEWKSTASGKQPYLISAADVGVLSIAGLWDRWRNPETGEPVISCTIIVTDANPLTRAQGRASKAWRWGYFLRGSSAGW
jgi:putative SOS response-associated peptidase YedK